MTTRPVYRVTATRGTRYWVLQADEAPGALSEVTRLDQAEDSIREAIAFVTELDPSSFDVEVVPDLPAAALKHMQSATRLRDEAADANASAAREARAAARELADAGLSMRDVGTVLGVSHQRAHQLIHA